MTSKAMSLRLPWDLADGLEAVARVDGMTMAEAIRKAIATHIASRQADLDFQKRLRKRLEEDREVLERLAK
jgi:predicted DNA-binding protein